MNINIIERNLNQMNPNQQNCFVIVVIRNEFNAASMRIALDSKLSFLDSGERKINEMR